MVKNGVVSGPITHSSFLFTSLADEVAILGVTSN